MRRKSKVSEETTIDSGTGEVLQRKSVSVYESSPEDYYVKVYLKQIEYLRKMTTAEITILFVLCKYIDYKNVVHTNIAIKNKIADDTGYSIQTISNSISSMVKRGLLIRKSLTSYIVNPEFIGKGTWKNISELRSVLEYASYKFK